MAVSRWERRLPLSGIVFVVLAVAGNTLQGSTPPPHAPGNVVADFYTERA